MLEYMRRNVGSWVIKFMLFGIAIVFSFWGVGSYTNRDTSTILTIDDTKVPYNEYRDIYNSLFDSYREAYPTMDSATLELLDIETQAIDALKERYILYEAARRFGVEVSGSEVSGQIASMQIFQENGGFSPKRYKTFLDLNRMTPEIYEASISRDLVLAKITELIKTSAVVTPQEVQDNLELLTRRAAAKVLRVDPNDFVRDLPPVEEEDLLDFFDENLELYRIPETFKLAIAVIEPAALTDKVDVAEEEMRQLYEDRESEYTEPSAIRLKHILFAFPEDASAQSISDIRVRAEDVVRMIRDSRITFEKAVARYSDDTDSIENGGDLGFIEESRLDRPVRNAAIDLEPAEISDPIPTADGFKVITVLQRREERLLPFEEVQEEIFEMIRQEKVSELAYDLADDLLDEVLDTGRPLEDVAREMDLKITITSLFTRDTALDYLEYPFDLFEAAFDMEEEEVGDIYELENKLYLFQTVERNDSYLPELDEVRDQVVGGLLVKQAMEAAGEKTVELAAEIEAGKSIESLAAALGKKVMITRPFTIMETSLDGIDDARQVVETAFALTEPGRAGAASGTQAHYLVVLDGFVEPDEEELDENRSMIAGALMFQREQDVFKGFVEALKEEMKDRIEVREELL